jgi:transcriptional regulator with XRE-family HTH domain
MAVDEQRLRDGALLLGLRVRECRLAAGLTLRLLSDQTSISVTHLSQIERGDKVPSLERLLALADAFEATVTDLLSVYPYGTSERPPAGQIRPPADGRRTNT